MVKRYRETLHEVQATVRMGEHPEGAYVLAADYDELRLSTGVRIADLEAALHEIADFSEQFIADDEDGDERMYKVNQIADTALGAAASGATTAVDREGDPTWKIYL